MLECSGGFLGFGAEIPSWRRITGYLLLLELGDIAIDHSECLLHGEASPPALQHWPSDSVSLQDFVDHWQPYNPVAITRILEERTKFQIEIESLKVLFLLGL
jgi:hypothetical protein